MADQADLESPQADALGPRKASSFLQRALTTVDMSVLKKRRARQRLLTYAGGPAKEPLLPKVRSDLPIQHMRSVLPGKLNYTWMLIFRLPNSVTDYDQAHFERLLARAGLTALEALQESFSFADPKAIKLALASCAIQGRGHLNRERSRSRGSADSEYDTPGGIQKHDDDNQQHEQQQAGGESIDEPVDDFARHTSDPSSSRNANSFRARSRNEGIDSAADGEEAAGLDQPPHQSRFTSEGHQSPLAHQVGEQEISQPDPFRRRITTGAKSLSLALLWPWRRRTTQSMDSALQNTIELCLAFLEALGQSIEDIMVDNSGNAGSKSRAAAPIGRVRSKGERQRSFQVSKFASEAKDLFYVCIRMRPEAMERLADLTEYPVQLSHDGIEKLGIKLTDPRTTPAYVKYDSFFRHLCQEHPQDHENTILRHIDRVRILYDQLTQYVDIPKLQSVGLIADCLPIHEKEKVMRLRESWGRFSLMFSLTQPLDDIRDYFGEEIAFYFVFLKELARASISIAIIALAITAFKHLQPQNVAISHSHVRILVSAMIMVWYTFFLKDWERRQALQANRWGVDAHVATTIKALPNRRFHGQLMESPENENTKTLQVSETKQLLGRGLAAILSVVFIVLNVAFVALEYSVFLMLQTAADKRPMLSVVLDSALGTLSGLQIKVIDSIWADISRAITDLEHRALQADFDWSRCIKTSVVRFINSVIAPLYWSFIGPIYDPRMAKEDLTTRSAKLASHFNGMFFIRFVVLEALNDTLKPIIHARMHGAVGTDEGEPLFTELQAKLDSYESSELFDDFLDVLIPLGYVLLFGCVDPLLIVQLMVVLLIQVRSDAWKLTHVYRRPYPTMAEGIGFFNTMLQFLKPVMVASNLALVFIDFGGLAQFLPSATYSKESLDQAILHGHPIRMGTLVDYLLCLGSAMTLLMIMHLFDFLIPRTSFFVLLERRRQDLQRYRLFYSGSSEGLQLRKVGFAAEKLRDRIDFSELTPGGGRRRARRPATVGERSVSTPAPDVSMDHEHDET